MMSETLVRYRVPIVGVLCVLLVTAGVLIYVRRPASQSIEIVEPSPTSGPQAVELAVYVTGAVLNPGVYYLPGESRVQDALEAAGGPAGNADLDRVNLAQRVHDEDQIYVPEVGEVSVPSASMGGTGGGLVDINAASIAELEGLPGIGPTLAQAVVDYREANGPFGSVGEIMEVQGIGQGVFEKIRELITVR
jgi:competence protein ComEA